MKYAVFILGVVLMLATPSLTRHLEDQLGEQKEKLESLSLTEDDYFNNNHTDYSHYYMNGASNYHNHNGMAAIVSLGFILSIKCIFERL